MLEHFKSPPVFWYQSLPSKKSPGNHFIEFSWTDITAKLDNWPMIEQDIIKRYKQVSLQIEQHPGLHTWHLPELCIFFNSTISCLLCRHCKNNKKQFPIVQMHNRNTLFLSTLIVPFYFVCSFLLWLFLSTLLCLD